jgi:uncharacterized membrane protein
MSRMSIPVLLAALGLAACNPHSADSTDGAAAGEPASAPASAPVTDFSGDFDLRGTEPFWSLIIRSDRLLLSRADGGDFTAPNNGPQVMGDTALWDGGPLKVTLVEKACSDGASDRSYAFTATVELTDAGPLKGCANRTPEP